MSNRAIRTCSPSAALDADLGDVARRESVELVKTIKVQFGSLAAGEHSMLRGCKLGNGAYGVVQHVADGTQGCHGLDLGRHRLGIAAAVSQFARPRGG